MTSDKPSAGAVEAATEIVKELRLIQEGKYLGLDLPLETAAEIIDRLAVQPAQDEIEAALKAFWEGQVASLRESLAAAVAERDEARADLDSPFGKFQEARRHAAHWKEVAAGLERGKGEAVARERGLRGALRFDCPWSILDVLSRLADLADHCQHTHGCDRHGHELDTEAKHAADVILKLLRTALAASDPEETTDGDG